MADPVCIADGNLTTAATWAVNDATGTLISTNTGSTTLTTGNLDSATFTPGAITIAGFALRLSARAAGSPSNTLTAILRNSTDGINVATVVINVSDLPQCATGAASSGGWHFFRINGNLTLTAGKAYLIRLTLSSTSTAVAMATNGTANNWQRILVTSTTGAPAAADDMHITQEFLNSTSPATRADRSVTMDQTAATDYGSAQTNAYVAGLDISKGGTLTFDTTINSLLRLSGHLSVYAGGKLKIGEASAEVPRDKTAVLEFDCAAADNDFQLQARDGNYVRAAGLSRTSGSVISQTLLTADQAAAATSMTVADVTNWLNGDEVAIASTSRTATQAEVYALSADATTTTISHTGTAAVNAHLGSASDKMQAEVILLARNVQIRSTSTTFMTSFIIDGASDVVCSWVLFRYMGGSGATGAVDCGATTGTASFSHCVVRDSDRSAYRVSGSVTTAQVTFDQCHAYRLGVVSSLGYGYELLSTHASATTAILSVTNGTIIADSTTANGLGWSGQNASGWPAANLIITNMRLNSCGTALEISAALSMQGGTWGPFYCHSGASTGVTPGTISNLTFTGDFYVWRFTGIGVDFQGALMNNVIFSGPARISGNGTANMRMQGGINGLRFYDLGLYGDTSFATASGISFTDGPVVGFYIDQFDCGTASGHYTTHTQDIIQSGLAILVQAIWRKVTFASATEFSGLGGASNFGNMRQTSWIAVQRKEATGVHFVITDRGRIDIEQTTVDVAPGMKMSPEIGTGYILKFESNGGRDGHGYCVPVASGQTVTPAVKVRKNGSYAGAAPRLICKANAALGINADVVLDTLSVGADTWETLTGTTAAVTDDGALEFVIDCDGAAGAVFVDSWSQTGGASTITSMQYWRDGLPLDILPTGSPGLQARSYPFMG